MRFDPFDPATLVDPYPYFRWMREHDPVYLIESLGMTLITRAPDVEATLRNTQVFSNAGWMEMMFGDYLVVPEAKFLLSLDPPEHTRLRRLVSKAFTPRMVADLHDRMAAIIDDELDALAASAAPDLVTGLCNTVPMKVIAAMTGVDADMYAEFTQWGYDIIEAINVNVSGITPEPAWEAQVRSSIKNLREYCQALMAERRQRPADDLTSALVHASDEGQRLNEWEVLSMIQATVLAGFETTGKAIGNMVNALVNHPDQLAMVRNDPSLVPNAVKESIRWDSPALFLPRQLKQDAVVAGKEIGAGNFTLVSYASANHDEAKFPDRPEEFDITRDTSGHIAFGLGVHYCLGAALAPKEMEMTLERLLARFSDIVIDTEHAERDGSFFLRGFKHLPVQLTPA